jgi:hypothetical protein
MEEPSFSLPEPEPKLQSEQNIGGNQNQAIGQVLGGMVVYGTVIYNNPPAAPNSATCVFRISAFGGSSKLGVITYHKFPCKQRSSSN